MDNQMENQKQNETIKVQRALLREMKASEDDPRAKALDRLEEKQKYDCVTRVTHTEKDD